MEPDAKNAAHLRLVIKKRSKLNYSRILGKGREHRRSSTKLKESKDRIIVEIAAKDLAALRASANSILRNIQVIEATKLDTKR